MTISGALSGRSERGSNVPTAIAVTSPDLVPAPPDGQAPGSTVPPLPHAAVLQPPESQSLDAALADMNLLLEQHGHVVVLHSSSLPAARVQRLHTVRSVLESDRIALLPLDLPPLGVAVLAQQLRMLSICDFSPGVLAGAAGLLSHYVYAGAVLNSVAKLDRVPVSLTSHARSWVPGSQFAVLAHPQPQLVRIGDGGALGGPGYGTHLLLAQGQLPSEWVTTVLAPAWRVHAVRQAPLPADSARWWGTSKLTEFTAFIPDISVLYQLVASVRRETCSWCGGELIGDRCAFCSSPVVPAENRNRPAGVPSREPAARTGT